jgi:glycosyltransferase involved in cell wall biosynthesis
MKISIITICYNDKTGFIKTSKSIIKQTYRDFEWIIIDGGSTDGTVEEIQTVKQYATFWSSEPDKGIYNAMNKGVTHATGEYVLFLNSGDCFASPKSLERVACDEWTADIVGCDMFVDTGKKLFGYNQAVRIVPYQRLIIGGLPHQSTFARISMLKETPFREDLKIASDWVFWCQKILKEKKTYQCINMPITVFDMNGISNTNDSLALDERRNNLLNYFAPEIVDQIIQECGVYNAIEGSYMYNMERDVQHAVYKTISRLFAHLIRPIIKLKMNILYRG